MTEPWRLIADVGGTNVRFARSRADGLFRDSQSWPAQSFDSFASALDAYLATLGDDASFQTAAIAAAGPVDSGAVELTNNDWRIETHMVAERLGGNVAVRLLNDLEAVAFALPHLADDQVAWIARGAPPPPRSGRMLAVNVGTGFGSAALLATGDEWISCPAESGHMRLVLQTTEELALIAELGLTNPTIEDVLSGHGIQQLWKACARAALTSEPAEGTPEDVFEFAKNDPASRMATRHFSTFLARAASDLVLASAAWDGLYLCGSVANAWSEHADFNEFLRTFRGESKMRDRLGQTPVAVIRHDTPAFIGLANVTIRLN